MGEENRLLSDEEIIALPDGARLYTEERTGTWVPSQWNTKSGVCLEGDTQGHYDMMERKWRYDGLDRFHDVRVWLREPTPDELAANPWPDTKEE